jgi:membrane protein DedA with SNARE-associated domain
MAEWACAGPDTFQESRVEEFLRDWGYLGILLGILATGVPFVPMPEELPVIVAGVLAGHGSAVWWLMLPLCIGAVVVGDFMLYGVGRLWGRRLLENGWVKKHILPPARLQTIEANFQKHGIKILLFARLTPGIRAPIFVTAGITRLAWAQFVVADAIYAVPGVTLLFFLGYWSTESVLNLVKHGMEHVKSIIILVAVLGVAAYFTYRFLRRPMVTGDPQEVPRLVEQVTHTLEQMTTKIIHPKAKPSTEPGAAPASDRDGRTDAAPPAQSAPVEHTKGEQGVSAP